MGLTERNTTFTAMRRDERPRMRIDARGGVLTHG